MVERLVAGKTVGGEKTSSNARCLPFPIPRGSAAQMRARSPAAQYVRIDNAGHLSNLKQPQAFNRSLRDFLDALPRSGSAL
ncbi:alpha/beta hydrolase [Variovorax sp. J31P207]|uniref:alpha/beta fold hydrolase n=1 Tax=Variovorax sp. J31P207 TaxID=3053510 RepID=UPI002574AC57|nr:alpha/beta hydrolase [Variovorax sp. J31P207]MDM0066799.1 alpha/beta hydrolase [Variovorax sp. J31P207]